MREYLGALFSLSSQWLAVRRRLTDPGGVGPSRISRIPQHVGQVEENTVQEICQWSQ